MRTNTTVDTFDHQSLLNDSLKSYFDDTSRKWLEWITYSFTLATNWTSPKMHSTKKERNLSLYLSGLCDLHTTNKENTTKSRRHIRNRQRDCNYKNVNITMIYQYGNTNRWDRKKSKHTNGWLGSRGGHDGSSEVNPFHSFPITFQTTDIHSRAA